MAGKHRLSLEHLVREPSGRGSESSPLLLLLHGVGSNEQDLMGLAPALDGRFLIVSARAPITLRFGSYAWYHVEFTQDGRHIIDPEEAESSRVQLLRFIDQLLEAYNVDSRRVFLMGFSQGCIMSLAVAMSEPRRFAGIVGMSGRLPPGMETKFAPAEHMRNLPVMIVHGTQDSVLLIEYGRSIRDTLVRLSVDLDYREYTMAHQVSQKSLADIGAWLSDRLDRKEDWRGLGG